MRPQSNSNGIHAAHGSQNIQKKRTRKGNKGLQQKYLVHNWVDENATKKHLANAQGTASGMEQNGQEKVGLMPETGGGERNNATFSMGLKRAPQQVARRRAKHAVPAWCKKFAAGTLHSQALSPVTRVHHLLDPCHHGPSCMGHEGLWQQHSQQHSGFPLDSPQSRQNICTYIFGALPALRLSRFVARFPRYSFSIS